MKRLIYNAIVRVRNLLVHEFPIALGLALAAAAAVSATPALILPAVGAALLRFVVSPAFAAAATKDKVLDAKTIEAVEKYLAVRDAVKSAQSAAVLAPVQASNTYDGAPAEPFTPAV